MRTNTAANTTLTTANAEETAMPTTETETTTEKTSRKNRKPAVRPEQLAAETTVPSLGHADTAIAIASGISTVDYAARLSETTAAVKPFVQLTDEQRAKIEKARIAKEKAEKKAQREAEKLAALERGEELPPATRGLPPVVKMNELGATARNLHRAFVLLASEEVRALEDDQAPTRFEASEVARRYRDSAMRTWQAQYDQRAAVGAADNDTLAPLGLLRDDVTGEVTLIEKKKVKDE